MQNFGDEQKKGVPKGSQKKDEWESDHRTKSLKNGEGDNTSHGSREYCRGEIEMRTTQSGSECRKHSREGTAAVTKEKLLIKAAKNSKQERRRG